jgi:hypothetical protein
MINKQNIFIASMQCKPGYNLSSNIPSQVRDFLNTHFNADEDGTIPICEINDTMLAEAQIINLLDLLVVAIEQHPEAAKVIPAYQKFCAGNDDANSAEFLSGLMAGIQQSIDASSCINRYLSGEISKDELLDIINRLKVESVQEAESSTEEVAEQPPAEQPAAEPVQESVAEILGLPKPDPVLIDQAMALDQKRQIDGITDEVMRAHNYSYSAVSAAKTFNTIASEVLELCQAAKATAPAVDWKTLMNPANISTDVLPTMCWLSGNKRLPKKFFETEYPKHLARCEALSKQNEEVVNVLYGIYQHIVEQTEAAKPTEAPVANVSPAV